ncbi:MAG: penicillin-binding transpeptidase domain-containing protein [Myxococcota bacterium]|nr:penicillin-binding transpeptidase domain-containing protein [Myxococcota bacterium]
MTIGKPALFLGQIGIIHLLIVYHALSHDADATHATSTTNGKNVVVHDIKEQAKTSLTVGSDLVATRKTKPRQDVPIARGDVLTPGAMRASAFYEEEGQVLADLDHGWSGQTTLDPWLTKKAKYYLKRGRVAVGAITIIDVKTGDVLALADHFDETNPATTYVNKAGPENIALRKIAPAASLFKLVSGAALLDHGLDKTRTYPYTYAKRKVTGRHLEKPELNAERHTLADALAKSNNGWFAWVTNKRLSRDVFVKTVDKFWFNKVVPFPILTDASAAQIPRNRLERARMSAGFGNTEITTLHAAVITAAIATDGRLPTPRLVSKLHGPKGEIIESPARQPLGRAMKESTARELRRMLTRTIDHGTARKAFKKWPKKLAHIRVGGKTGTLARRRAGNYIGYTWFVAYAPANNPEIAMAVMVGNSEKWWQRAVDIGRDILGAHFRRKPRRAVTAKRRDPNTRTTR